MDPEVRHSVGFHITPQNPDVDVHLHLHMCFKGVGSALFPFWAAIGSEKLATFKRGDHAGPRSLGDPVAYMYQGFMFHSLGPTGADIDAFALTKSIRRPGPHNHYAP